jgi:hypothetical protein
MFRQLKIATVIAVALSTLATIGSVEAHIGGRGGGIRIGGGLAPRGRLPGNGNRIGGNVAGRPAPAPVPKPVAPPIVQIGGTTPKTTKPSTGTVISTNSIPKTTPPQNIAPKSTTDKVPSPNTPAPVPTPTPVPAGRDVVAAEPQPKKPADSNVLLVFNLTGSAAPDLDRSVTDAPAAPPTGLSLEARQALADLTADVPAAESTPSEVASKEEVTSKEGVTKEVPVPQIPVGATVTLNGKDLSDREGQVVLQIGEIALPATITAWKNNMVTCTLPVLGLTKSSKATLHVLKADGKTASMLDCELVIALPAR